MPTYADNYTPRVRGFYTSGGKPHVMKTRIASGTTPTLPVVDAQANAMNNFILNMEADMSDDWAWLGWEWAAQDSDIWVPFAPVLLDTIVGGQASGGYSPVAHVTAACMSGRAAGSKARVYFFGLLSPQSLAPNEGGDGILTSTEVTGLPAAKGEADGFFRAGNGEPAIFYERLTYKVNDRLLRDVRRGL